MLGSPTCAAPLNVSNSGVHTPSFGKPLRAHLEVRELWQIGLLHNALKSHNLIHFSLDLLKHYRVTDKLCESPLYCTAGFISSTHQNVLQYQTTIISHDLGLFTLSTRYKSTMFKHICSNYNILLVSTPSECHSDRYDSPSNKAIRD